ncbi:MAG: hypothetical protein KDB27_10090 [Planctomycetales bacterium]|nr:hypothetical protein [Planctomycetales bacterium]
MGMSRKLHLEQLDNKLMLTTVVEHDLPNDRQELAQEFTIPDDGVVTIQGVSDDKDDKDFFRVRTESAVTLTVEVESNNDNVPQLEIEDQSGQEVLETEPNDGINSGNVVLQAWQTYFLRLRSKEKGRAEYTVSLVFNDDSGEDNNDNGSSDSGQGTNGNGNTTNGDEGAVHEIEPNDRKSTANTIELGRDSTVQITGTSVSSDDEDFFTFVATASGVLTGSIVSPNGNVAQLEVEDTSGRNVLETEPNDGVNAASGVVEEGNSYFARLRSKNDSPAEYVVTLAIQPGADNSGNNSENPVVQRGIVNEVEPNDKLSQATVFAFDDGGTAQLNGVSEGSADSDYFRFTAQDTGQLTVQVNGASTVAQLQIEDANGHRIFETEPNDGINSGRVGVTAGQTHSIRLRSKNDSAATYLTDLAFRQVGDSNGDQLFDSSDMVRIFQAAKYRTGAEATFEDGDWNNDGVFDEKDLILAFQAGRYVGS